MQEMVIYGVSFDMVGKQPIVLLKTVEGNRFLPIWIGHAEASAILMTLQGTESPRPMTHDLLVNLVTELRAEVARITITELRDATFHAMIRLSTPGEDVELDCRPSDAMAVAVRTGSPIYAADAVLDENAIEFEHEPEDDDDMVEKFKEFLDQVTPEDFAEGS
ncbi:MAG: bifunctional nuclease family protein [Miltoncostaeaceae bacterium]